MPSEQKREKHRGCNIKRNKTKEYKPLNNERVGALRLTTSLQFYVFGVAVL
jgi:hypothetical protein